jgi:hypothetical protein
MERLPGQEKSVELGRALRRIDDRIVRQDAQGKLTRSWFQGPELYLDVFFEEGRDGLEWFQVTLRGRSLTWDRSRGFVVTGHTNELDTDDPLHPASKTIATGAGWDGEVVQAVRWMFAARAGEAPFDAASAVLARWMERG